MGHICHIAQSAGKRRRSMHRRRFVGPFELEGDSVTRVNVAGGCYIASFTPGISPHVLCRANLVNQIDHSGAVVIAMDEYDQRHLTMFVDDDLIWAEYNYYLENIIHTLQHE